MKNVGLSPTHCSFKLQNEVLSIHNLGKETYIGKKELHSGKMYILDKGDKLTIGELEVLIRQDEIEDDDAEEDDLNKMIERTQSKTQIVRPGIVSKLLNKGPQIKQKVVVPEYNYPLFLVRFYSFLFTLSVSYGVYYFLIPNLELNYLVTKLMSIINPLIDKAFVLLNPHLSAQWIEHLQFIKSTSIILITLIYFSQNIIFALIFGQSLPFTFLSISSDQSFVFKRISGLMRNIIAVITTPLIIFDLMAIIGKRTTKEFLTRTHPVYHSQTFKLISLVLIFPLVILIGIFSPSLKDPTIFDESLFIPALKKTSKLNSGAPKFNSKYFKISSSILENDSTFFFPLFSKKTNEFTIEIIQSEKNQKVTLSKGKPVDLWNLANSFQEGNPLLRFTHTAFFNHISNQKTELIPKAKEEFEKLITSAFSMTPNSLDKVLLSHGPFVNGMVEFRKSFQTEIQMNSMYQISISKINKDKFLTFSPLSIEVRNQIGIIPLHDKTGPSFLITFDKKSNGLAQKVLNKVIKTSTFISERPMESIENSFDLIDILNTWKENGLGPEQQASFLGHLSTLTQRVKELNQDQVNQSYDKMINSIKLIINSSSQDEAKKDELLNSISDLIQ